MYSQQSAGPWHLIFVLTFKTNPCLETHVTKVGQWFVELQTLASNAPNVTAILCLHNLLYFLSPDFLLIAGLHKIRN